MITLADRDVLPAVIEVRTILSVKQRKDMNSYMPNPLKGPKDGT